MPGLLDNILTFRSSVIGMNEQFDGSKRKGRLVVAALLAVATTGSIFLPQRKQKNVHPFDCSIDEAFGEDV